MTDPAGGSDEGRTVSVRIARDPREVYAYAADPRNLPAWSFVEAIEPDGASWVATVPGGDRVRMTFGPPGERGVLDHEVELGTGEVVRVPLRVVPDGAGSTVLLTTLRRPGGTDEDLAADAAAAAQDLATLKAVLEG